ncbi:MAG: pyruvate dehydrogenase (acetyl-transferring) E1 component subunit alpha [Candidatus Berkiellales bacterium]
MAPKTQIVAEFRIPYFRYLNPQGELEQPVPSFAKNKDDLIALYRMMIQTRLFDTKAITLQRTGKLGTYPSMLGQEAVSVGIGAAMDKEDIFCPYYRDCGTQFWRGVKMEEILLYWGGDERGSDFADNAQDLPICIPVASQTLHAAGIAFAVKYKKQNKVVVTTLGDGGTSRGDFYESMNIAGVWELPLVFIINNNQWAISLPRRQQTSAQTLAQKAIAAGLEGWQIDGNDVIAVKDAVDQAIKKARAGKGATVIEALTYRRGDHTTADDASRYRSQEELIEYEKLDPIDRLKHYVMANHFWDASQEKTLHQEIMQKVDVAVKNFENSASPAPESMFDYLYETLPEVYESQRLALKKGKGS